MKINLKWRGLGSAGVTLSLLTFVFFSFQNARAELPRRSLELELEDVQGNTGYEIEVVRILSSGSKKPPFKFKIKDNVWKAKLVPGNYILRVRALDERGVPGEWSAAQNLEVKLPGAALVKPEIGMVIKSEEDDTEKIEFEWKTVEGAEKYKIRVLDRAGAAISEDETGSTSTSLKVPVAQFYTWHVAAISPEGIEGDVDTNLGKFELYGGPLPNPKIHQIEDTNTEEFHWDGVEKAQKYEYVLLAKNEKKQWQKYTQGLADKNSQKLPKPIPTGEYKFFVRPVAEYRLPSKYSTNVFTTQNIGNRSPAAVEQVKSEGSYGSKSNIFALASYYITIMNYAGTSVDRGTEARYDAVGGTGRLGLGTWFGKNSPWGALVTADMSGFTLENTTYRYVSGNAMGIYRYRLGALGQLRGMLGAQYRQLPVTIGSPATGPGASASYLQSTITTLGPVAGVNLLHGLTRRLGVQMNAQVMYSIMGLATPNGKSNSPRLSYQLGLLGSLSLSDTLVGFMGYAYRSESAAFNSDIPPNAIPPRSGDNTTAVTGHYINFMLEYGF